MGMPCRLTYGFHLDPGGRMDGRLPESLAFPSRFSKGSQFLDNGSWHSSKHISEGESISSYLCQKHRAHLAHQPGECAQRWEQSFEALNLEESLLLLDNGTNALSIENYIHLLGKCRKTKALEHAQKIYLHICNDGLEDDRKLGNHLVPTLVECGTVDEAQKVFNRLLHHNEYSWTALLQGYINDAEFEYTLSLWERMQLSGIHPSTHSFVPMLQACAELNYSDEGRKLHCEIIFQGFEGDSFLGDTLVDMYGKCGLMMEAQEVFDKLIVRSVVSYTALIAGYVRQERGESALVCFAQMHLESILPNDITYLLILKACISIGDLRKGQETHALIVQEGYENNAFLSSALIDMYTKFGSMIQARDVFDELDVSDVVIWTTIIAGYVEHGLFEEALVCFKGMRSKGIFGNTFAFVCILKPCSDAGDEPFIQEMHQEIIKGGLEDDPIVGSTLMAAYSNCGSFQEALKVFDDLRVKDSVVWAALISLYDAQGCHELVLSCLEKTREEGFLPNAIAYKCSLKSCWIGCAIDGGLCVHAEILKEGIERDPLISVALIEMYSKHGYFDEARLLLNGFHAQCVVSWNALISGYHEHKRDEEILLCVKEMQREKVPSDTRIFLVSLNACANLGDIEVGREMHIEITKKGIDADPYVETSLIDMYSKCKSLIEADALSEMLQVRDVVSWTALILLHAEHGYVEESIFCLEQMHMEGFAADDVTFVCILKSCSELRHLQIGQHLHACVVKRGLEGYNLIGSSLIDMYGRCGCLLEASEVFEKCISKERDVWTTLLHAHADCGYDKELFRIYNALQKHGISPDCVQINVMLKACSRLVSVQQGHIIHSCILKFGMDANDFLASSLMLMYAAFGMTDGAQGVFDKLLWANIDAWNALIHVHVICGDNDKAYDCLRRMQHQKLSPSRITYLHLLRSCNRGNGRIWELHLEIAKMGLETDTSIGCSLLEMYGKCFSLEEAQNAFDKISVHDTTSWTTLMEVYVCQGLVMEGLKHFELMQVEGFSPDAVTFGVCLKACKCLGEASHKIQEIHNHVVIVGLEADPFITGNLIETYLKHGLFKDGRTVFDLDRQNFSALVLGYAENGMWEEILYCAKEMHLTDSLILIYALKACAYVKTLEKGKELHLKISKVGLDADPYISSSLINMYSKCGSFAEARMLLFNGKIVPDNISWSALILGYLEYNFAKEAFNCLGQMHMDGVPHDEVNVIQSLEACSMIKDIDKGHKIHMEVLHYGLEQSVIIGGSLLHMYGNCGFIHDACFVFDQLPTQDVVTWTELMLAYVMNGFADEALNCLDQMKLDGASPDTVSFIIGLKACVYSSKDGIVDGKELHTSILKLGFDADVYVGNSLIDMYCKSNSVAEAQDTFDRLPASNIISWTTLISGYMDSGFAKEALNNLDRMHLDGVVLDEFGIVCSLEACSMVCDMDKSYEIHSDIVKFGLEGNSIIESAILSTYANCGPLVETENVFRKLSDQDVITWTELMKAYLMNDRGSKALNHFGQAQLNGISPDVISFICILKVCYCMVRTGNEIRQEEVHVNMDGAISLDEPNHITRSLVSSRELHMQIAKFGFDMDTCIRNSLISVYSKCGAFAEAWDVFSMISNPNVVSWTATVPGYVYHGLFEEALGILDRMQSAGVQPDEANFICSLDVCRRIKTIEKGHKFHTELIKVGLEGNLMIGAMLLCMYGECGFLNEVENVFSQLPIQDVVTWTEVMFAYLNNGLADKSLWCFEQMQMENIAPDALTFICCLKACESIGALDDARRIFSQAVKQGADMDPMFSERITNVKRVWLGT